MAGPVAWAWPSGHASTLSSSPGSFAANFGPVARAWLSGLAGWPAVARQLDPAAPPQWPARRPRHMRADARRRPHARTQVGRGARAHMSARMRTQRCHARMLAASRHQSAGMQACVRFLTTRVLRPTSTRNRGSWARPGALGSAEFARGRGALFSAPQRPCQPCACACSSRPRPCARARQ